MVGLRAARLLGGLLAWLLGVPVLAAQESWSVVPSLGVTFLSPFGGIRAVRAPRGLERYGSFTAATAKDFSIALAVESPSLRRGLAARLEIVHAQRGYGDDGAIIDGVRVERALADRTSYVGAGVRARLPGGRIRPFVVAGAGLYLNRLAGNDLMIPPLGDYRWTTTTGVAMRGAAGLEYALGRAAIRAELGLLQPVVGRGQPAMPLSLGVAWRP